MGKQKLFNDPIYGLVNFKSEFIYDLINHPYYQRLRRIDQMGMTHLVYPGATHTRFQHAIGALYLMQSAVSKLKDKGVVITNEESEAACVAMLLHDIGHGPISHSLERLIVNVDHEVISLKIMDLLNEEFSGKLDLAIRIFKNEYNRPFLHQLVSGQLDLDRMDYITRDAYYTGVAEGTIGYDRIISMFNVVNDELVVEEKAVYSIQKFLIAREIMYKQVYLHKTSIAAEQMLKKYFQRVRIIFRQDEKLVNDVILSPAIQYFLKKDDDILAKSDVKIFLELDDTDIFIMLKSSQSNEDFIIRDLSNRLLKRNLFKTEISGEVFASDFVQSIRQKVKKSLMIDDVFCDWYIIKGREQITTYSEKKEEIKILTKQGTTTDLTKFASRLSILTYIDRYFLCYPT